MKFFRDIRDDPEPLTLRLFDPRRLRFPVTLYWSCFLLLNGVIREVINQCFRVPSQPWPGQGIELGPFTMAIVLLIVSLPVVLAVDLCKYWLARLKRGPPSGP